MMKPRVNLCVLIVSVASCASFAATGCAQDQPAEAAAKSDESKPAQPEKVAPSPADVLAALVKDGDLDEAVKAVDEAAAADGDNAQLPMFRTQLAMRLTNTGKTDEGIVQMEAARAFHLAHLDNEQSVSGLAGTTITLRSLYGRAGEAEKAGPLLDESIEMLKPHVDKAPSAAALNSLASLVSASAMMLATTDAEAAATMLASECDAMKARVTDDTESSALLAWTQLMQSRISIAGRDNADAAAALTSELDESLSAAVAKQPESVELTSAYVRMRLTGISRIVREDPDTAQQMFDQTKAAIDQSPIKENAAITRMVSQLMSLERMIAAAKVVKEMIGKPAPAFDIDAWAHGEPLSQESLQGKVVMLDFWAIWCGPCVATFPHLKEWHEEFHDKGFEIIGVTRKYGYSWNEETGKADRARSPAEADAIDMETESNAIAKFMDSHELHHPTIITPKDTEMNEQYGVTGIPHAVLIDRQGNVRMVKVGSGEANASALRAMIETLIAE